MKEARMAQRIPGTGQFIRVETRTNKDKTMIVLGIAIMILFILIVLSSVAWGNSWAAYKPKGRFAIPYVFSELLQQSISSPRSCSSEIEGCES